MKKQVTIQEIEQTRQALELSIGRLIDAYETMVPMVVEEIEIGQDELTKKNIVMIKDFLTTNSDVYIKGTSEPEKDL